MNEEIQVCKCDNKIEIGFHRCKDNTVYITYLCSDCQHIIIEKLKLEKVDVVKAYV